MLTQSLSPRAICARPNGAPAYYLGRPATFWIAAMSPRPEHATAGHARTAGPPVSIPRPELPRVSVTVPPTPRLSAVHRPLRKRERIVR
jgi:hypothetical protein